MGAKGKVKTPGSGRRKGTPNKATEALESICERHNLNPFEAMVVIASDPLATLDQKISVLKDLCQYLYPKRKSIEMSGDVEGITVNINDYTSKP